MTHQTVEHFIGEVLSTDVQHLQRAASLLQSLAHGPEPGETECLVSDIRHLGELMQVRARNHFRLAQHLGTCAGLAEERPRLAAQLIKITDEQDRLMEQLAVVRGACEMVDLGQPDSFVALGESLVAFLRMLEVHAERENLFVLEAYNQEIGSLD